MSLPVRTWSWLLLTLNLDSKGKKIVPFLSTLCVVYKEKNNNMIKINKNAIIKKTTASLNNLPLN